MFSIDEDDFEDDSDDPREDHAPRHSLQRVEFIPDETISVARDGRIRLTLTQIEGPASPSKKSQVPGVLNPDMPPLPALQSSHEGWEENFSEFDAEYGPGFQQGPREPRSSDDPNEQWVRLDREDFLDELIRHDGRGEYIDQTVCAGEGCETTDAPFRCIDCFHGRLYCKECMVKVHQRMPLHHVEMWKGTCFKRCTLKTLGLRIQLGHLLGQRCSNPARAAGDDFVIVNSHTIDEAGLDYCNCGQSKPRPIQLLRMRLYPATGTNPRSAATFAALDRFDLMCLESKCSAYEFYNSLARETDNTGLEPSRVSLLLS
ncbi:hypothetical protein B0H10DRAFT_2297035 [Mycena sp. CBHHK59/15]|nr:hypothetical protein B0H10DRAFT_2297035 [Mycena sp. CBHHK59/15]